MRVAGGNRRGTFRWRGRVVGLAAAGALALLGMAGGASAHVVEPIVYSGNSFNGAGSTAGEFSELEGIAVDTAHQKVYTLQRYGGGGFEGWVSRFDMAGTADPFSGLSGASSVKVGPVAGTFEGSHVGIAVDGSPGGTGSWYVLTRPYETTIQGYWPDGLSKAGFPINLGHPCGIAVDPQGDLWYADNWAEGASNKFYEVDSATGEKTGAFINVANPLCHMAIDSAGNFYGSEKAGTADQYVFKFSPTGELLYKLDIPDTGGVWWIATDPANDHVYVGAAEFPQLYEGFVIYEFAPDDPKPIEELHTNGEFFSPRQVAVDGTTHDLYVAERNRVRIYKHEPPITVPDVTTGTAVPTPTTAELRGTVNADGVATTDCHFEWGTTVFYGKTAPCDQGNVQSGSSDVQVTATVGGLKKGSTYHFRLVAKNSTEYVVRGKDTTVVAQDFPKVSGESVSNVNTDGAIVHAHVTPEAGTTGVHVEYGTDTSYGSDAPVQDVVLPSTKFAKDFQVELSELQPSTEYHYRVVATNAAGVTKSSADHTFTTFPVASVDNSCPNALARQQTGSALLLDCRAYELVSAANTGGYDVESDLVPGQHPYPGYPLADDRVLYGVHNGGIPGSGEPTNHGIDPYIATRGEGGWTTRYVGVPASGRPPFASPLIAASDALDVLAFGGPDICAPCFGDGSSGIPVRLSDGTLAQGMSGASDPAPATTSEGLVTQPMSADGSHLVFGSISQLQPDGNNGTGDISIYERDLQTGVTQVVSKTPAGANLPCLQGAGACHPPAGADGLAELAISGDGSRVVVAQKVHTDSAGNDYWHPYMHVGTSSNTVDLAPGTTSGVLFDGMTADGSRVFLTTSDQLLPADTDSSADIYEAKVTGSGPATLRLVSTMSDGNPRNDDGCTPEGNWNVVAGGPDCSAVAFAGGAGLAAGSGAFYFLSPEQLDGSEGMADQANLYLVPPDESPRFVTIMDWSSEKPPPPPPDHPVINTSLVGGLAGPEALAVNQNTGDIYVKERNTSTIARFHSDGTPADFTEGPNAGTNRITGENLGGSAEGQIDVDSHPGSLFENAFYVTSNGGTVSVFAGSGKKLGTIEGFGEACGVTVDQSTGVVYVGDYYGIMKRLEPISNATPVTNADYAITQMYPQFFNPCQVAADTEGNVYASAWSSGPVKRWESGNFAASPSSYPGAAVSLPGNALYVDPGTNDLYLDTGTRLDVYDSTGAIKETLAENSIGNSRGVAVNATTHHIYASSGQDIVELGNVEHPPDPIDNPAIKHAVRAAGVHDSSDFQVTPDGRYAAFSSAVPITGYRSSDHLEVFRYDSQSDEISCASCPPTNAGATGNASLADHGLSVTDDGRVFFTSTEPLVLRDTDSVKDAYEWSDGRIQLISAGSSLFDSGLLTATADGRDVFFFTRDKLTRDDENGSVMKIYDAREGGGRFVVPAPPQCAASDECHGPGSPQPPNLGIASLAGSEGNEQKGERGPQHKCRKGFVRKHGKCLRKHRSRRQRR